MARDMTKGNITGHLIAYAVPLVFGNLFQQLYHTVDSVVVGQFYGKEALAAVGAAEGNSDFANRHMPLLRQWAAYLIGHGTDPENQLCTDDFAGHLAHNCNLSLKAIMAIGAFSLFCVQNGDADGIPRKPWRHSGLKWPITGTGVSGSRSISRARSA